MNKQELTDWAMDVFWPTYTTLCKTPFPTKWKGGPRGAAVKKIQTLNPSEDLRQRIILGAQAQILHRRKLYQKLGSMAAWNTHTDRNKFYCNRNGEAWINQIGWDDEIPALEDDEQTSVSAKCHCGKDVHGPSFNECADCMGYKNGKLVSPYADKMREFYAKRDLNHDYIVMLGSKYGGGIDIMRLVKKILRGTIGLHNSHVGIYKLNKLTEGHKNILLDK